MANYPPYGQPMYQQPIYPQQAYQQQQQAWQNRVQQPTYQPPVQQYSIQPAVNMVTCREEAVAAQIDFNPSIVNVYVDTAHGMIYTKQFNPTTGAADFGDYQRINPEHRAQQDAAQQDSPEYVTVEAFRVLESRINGAFEEVRAALDDLESRHHVYAEPEEGPALPPVKKTTQRSGKRA